MLLNRRGSARRRWRTSLFLPRLARNGLLNSPCARDRIVFSLDPALRVYTTRPGALHYHIISSSLARITAAQRNRPRMLAYTPTTRGVRCMRCAPCPRMIPRVRVSLMYSGPSARLGTSPRALGTRLRSLGRDCLGAAAKRVQRGREVNFVYNSRERERDGE